jgi:nanoRNase/pAp phosphatase (c-di-AMP/oligoRNAs hydrolase)
VSTPQEERSGSPSLLLMISDAAEIDASVRSGHRVVRRWKGEAGACSPDEFGGDPALPETYGWTGDARTVTAVVNLKDDERAEKVVAALRSVRPDAAMLVLSEAVDHAPGDGTLTRAGQLRDVLRLDLEDELIRLEAERRSFCLRRFADGCEVVPILIHPDPDPDALSSALAVRTLLQRTAASAPIVATGGMKRPENRRMAELLKIVVMEVSAAELHGFERLIVVDMQPSGFDGVRPALAVIDHHPAETEYCATFLDVRPEYGAVATMMTEYLRSQNEQLVSSALASALLTGIRTDTDRLSRGVVAADVNAYAWLLARADRAIVRRIEKPSYPEGAARGFGRALHEMLLEGELAVAYAGELEQAEAHILADLADFCMEIDGVTRAVAAGLVDGTLILTLRDIGTGNGVGDIARSLAERGGNGGGHATMARAMIPLAALPEWNGLCRVDAVLALVRQAQGAGAGAAGRAAEVSRRS